MPQLVVVFRGFISSLQASNYRIALLGVQLFLNMACNCIRYWHKVETAYMIRFQRGSTYDILWHLMAIGMLNWMLMMFCPLARLRFVRHTDGEALSIVNLNDRSEKILLFWMKKRLEAESMKRSIRRFGLSFHQHLVCHVQISMVNFTWECYGMFVNSPIEPLTKMPCHMPKWIFCYRKTTGFLLQ